MKTRCLLVSLVLGLVLVLALLWLLVRVVRADPDTIYVSTTGTDGLSCGTVGSPCRTIPYAVDNRAQAGDVVVVAAGTYTEAFSLKAGVVISGAGASVTIVDGENARGQMVTASDSGITSSAVLRGVTIRRGTTSDSGGGVYVINNASPTIEDCVIQESTAAWYGGGIYVQGGATPTIEDCIIRDNTATYHGGGVAIYDASPTLRNAQVLDNSADGHGGGVYIWWDASPTIVGGRVAANTAYTDTSGGGGFYIGRNSSPTISDTQVVSNSTAGSGGGYYVWYDSSIALLGGEVLSNTASGHGGGIYIYYDSSATIEGTHVVSNVARNDFGGGIAVNYESSAVMTDVHVFSNTAGDDGGGIWVNQDSELTFTGGRVQGNEAAGDGGGFVVTFRSTALISGAQVLNNQDYWGFAGGIYLSYIATPTIRNCAVADNAGYGIRVTSDVDTVTVTQSTVRNNGAGGIYLASSSALVDRTLIYGHTSSAQSGIYVAGGSPTLTGNTCRQNYYGVRVNGSAAHPVIRDGDLISNSYGLYVQQGNATLGAAPGRGNNIYGNTQDGVFNGVSGSTCITASYNYWGAAGGPDDDSEDADACYPLGNLNDNDPADDVSDGVWYGAWLNGPTAVTLSFFAAAWNGDVVAVAWETAIEIDTLGFNVWRSETRDGGYVRVNDAVIPAASLGGVWGGSYSHIDSDVIPGTTYYYKLEELEVSGARNWYGPVSTGGGDDNPTAAILLRATAGKMGFAALACWLVGAAVVLGTMRVIAWLATRYR